MAIAQLDIRLDENIKAKAEHEMMVVEGSAFDQFVEACDKANNPNTVLLTAAEFTKESLVE
ncbi:DUF1778 domain-containing protein [Psychromonas arctica]|uniref:DUF1778 domain-containing protein n=1 Tax=Psychromonas arctica TaxID=168275 RepID=A0ABU9HA94_9GAMM